MTDKHASTWKRRRFLKATAAAVPVFTHPGLTTAAEHCQFTASTEDGPPYPAEEIPWNADLTRLPGRQDAAQGQPVYLFGRVKDVQCAPVNDAVVEIWQADNSGYYKHPRHNAPDGLDPAFGYFGKVRADEEGRYVIKTIVPKWYRIFNIDRAAHIHIKVRSALNGVITSEIYFTGEDQDQLREIDPVFQSRRAKESLVVDRDGDFGALGLDLPDETNTAYCQFDLQYRL